ncbi:MAG: hypothetical protein GXO77_06450 [Calditrichaeota bacterium]|nr:hypothetical protein [Calditrichota bacterium]
MSKKRLDSSEVSLMMSDVVSIIYQVTDLNVALDMILDTCNEYLKIPHVGIARFKEEEENFSIIKSRNFDREIESKFQFNLFTPINGMIIRKERPSKFNNMAGTVKIGNKLVKLNTEVKTLYLFPFRFHEQINGFLEVLVLPHEKDLTPETLKLLSGFVNLTAPIFHVFGPLKRRGKGFENIISKIIKDRIYEARLGLYPVSFSIFRISLWHEMISTVALQDTVQTYQELFDQKLGSLGDVIWLTLDTAFFIFPNADLFSAESICNTLKEEAESAFSKQRDQIQVALKYVCISYPQSGEDAGEIISQLWIRLFDELRSEVFTNH